MTTQTYYPVANSVGPQQVRETDEAYIIEDVPFIRPMELAGGYVPEQSVRETADAWDGVPATLNHPRDDSGMPVAANQQPETHIGTTEAPYYDGTHVRGNIRLEKARLDGRGAEATRIETALDNGETIDVSSQYAAEPLPAGEYDGEVRENVERITRPDSVAILPTKTGVCTIEDGCGINPQLAANAAVSVPMTANGNYGDKDMASSAEAEFSEGDLVRWSTSDSPGTGRVNTVAVEPGATVSAEGADVTREATAEEPAYKLDNYVGPEAGYDEGVVVKSASEIIGPWEDAPDEAMSANMDVPDKYVLDNPGAAVEMASEMGFGEDAALAGDELIHTHEADGETVFMPGPSHEALLDRLEELGEVDADGDTDGDMSDNSVRAALRTLRAALTGADDEADASEDPDRGPASTRDRAALIDDITSNSPLTRHALEARCDEGLAAIHDDVMAAAETGVSGNTDDSDAAADTTTTTMSDSDPIELDDLSENAREALVDEAVERIEANRETEQKEQLVSEIIANAADYDSDDRETLLETPLDVLRSLNTSTQAAGLPGTGATANAAPSTGTDDSVEEYPDGMIGGDL
jgi:hypothetical protein